MVTAHLQTVTVRQLNVALKIGVYAVAALRGFQVNVSHLSILADRLPEHLSLIVAEVDTMNVLTGVLTLDIGVGVVVLLFLRHNNASLLRLFLRFLLGNDVCFRFRTALLGFCQRLLTDDHPDECQ